MGILFTGNNSAEIWGGEYVATANPDFFFSAVDFVPGYMRIQMPPTNTPALMSCQFPPSSSDTTWAHFVWGSNAVYGSGSSQELDMNGFTLVNAAGKILGGVNIDKPTNNPARIQAFAFGTTRVKDTNFHVFSATTPHQIDVKMEIDDVAKEITVEVYVNGGLLGVAVSAYSGTRPANPVHAIWHNTSLATNNNFVYLREVIITDDEDPRSWRLSQQFPSAQGNYDQWQGGYEELADASRASRALSDTAGQRTSMTFTGYNGPVAEGGVRAVMLNIFGAAGVYGGPDRVEPFIRSGTTDYDLGPITLTKNDNYYPVEIDEDPATSSPWASVDLDGMEIGLVSRAT